MIIFFFLISVLKTMRKASEELKPPVIVSDEL